MKETHPRRPAYAKSKAYEALLEGLNADIERLGPREPAGAPVLPVIFVVGLPRSGTTLLYQLLAAAGAFEYPTNLIARFYRSPSFGSRIQRLVEPLLERGPMSFRSRAGATTAWYEPHEFGYFWERHFPFHEHHEPDAAALAAVDWSRFAAELADYQAQTSRPLLFKNVILSFILREIADRLPTARFIHIRRPPLAVAESMYKLRVEYFGAAEAWLGPRPREACESSPPEEQIACQIDAVAGAIERAEASIAADRRRAVDYDRLCREPRAVVAELLRFAGADAAARVDECPESFIPPARPEERELRARLERALSARGRAKTPAPGAG
jgi:Sulfotransferase family